MWVAVLLVLLVSGFIFYSLAQFHKHINEENEMEKEIVEKVYLEKELEHSKDKHLNRKTGKQNFTLYFCSLKMYHLFSSNISQL